MRAEATEICKTKSTFVDVSFGLCFRVVIFEYFSENGIYFC